MTRATLPSMTEKALQAAVIQCARLLGFACYHTWLSARSEPGFPDILAVRGQRLLAIELKSARGALSPAQTRWLHLLEGAGVETYLWRPADWHSGEVECVLRGED